MTGPKTRGEKISHHVNLGTCFDPFYQHSFHTSLSLSHWHAPARVPLQSADSPTYPSRLFTSAWSHFLGRKAEFVIRICTDQIAKIFYKHEGHGSPARSRSKARSNLFFFAGGLKTDPIFKRFADMCDKRTRWIHCYLQYFVHFQCSLHGHADSQILIANLRQKKTSNFQNMHFVRVSCTFSQKIVQIVFSFSTCQIVRVGWGWGWVGGDDNVP